MDQSQHEPWKKNRPEWESAVFPCIYQLRVRGRIRDHARVWFEGMVLSVDEAHSPPQTIMRGEILDHAALYGLISRIRDLGLTLLSVERVE